MPYLKKPNKQPSRTFNREEKTEDIPIYQMEGIKAGKANAAAIM